MKNSFSDWLNQVTSRMVSGTGKSPLLTLTSAKFWSYFKRKCFDEMAESHSKSKLKRKKPSAGDHPPEICSRGTPNRTWTTMFPSDGTTEPERCVFPFTPVIDRYSLNITAHTRTVASSYIIYCPQGLNLWLARSFLCSFYTVTIIQPLPAESRAPQEKRTSVKIYTIKCFLDYQFNSIIDRTLLKTSNEQVGATGQFGTFLNRDVIVHMYLHTRRQLPHIALQGRPNFDVMI